MYVYRFILIEIDGISWDMEIIKKMFLQKFFDINRGDIISHK